MSCCITGFGLPAPAPASAQHLGGRSGCSSARSLSTRTPSVGGSAGCRSNASGCPTAAPPAVPPRVLSSLGRALRHSASCPHLARCPPLGAIAEPEGGCAAPCRLARACSVHDHIPDSLGWPEKTFSFTPERFLGQGTFGSVYLAHDPVSAERVAVKAVNKHRLAGDVTSKAELFSTLQQEVDMMRRMRGPRVVALKSVCEDDQFAYIAMEVCDGSLQDLLDCHPGPIPEPVAAALARQMVAALAEVHAHSVCYSDIKPANFLLKARPGESEFGIEVKLSDFGCSQDLTDEDFLTVRTGTPLYTAPEVFLGRYGLEADLWGLGVILYRMLAGVYPFRPNLDTVKPSAMMMSVLHDPLRLDAPAWERVSPEAKDLVGAMLARCVRKRVTAGEALAHPWFSAPQPPCDGFAPFGDAHAAGEVVANNVEPFQRQALVAQLEAGSV